MTARTFLLLAMACFVAAAPLARAEGDLSAFETGQVRPLALSPDGTRLFVLNTPDDRLEIFDVNEGGLQRAGSVFVGLEPVAVAARSNSEVWVVNHLSDSVSIVETSGVPRVVRTLLVGDEPGDVVFAGPSSSLAFVTTAHRGQNIPFDPQPFTPETGRADVWVFDTARLGDSLAGEPKTIVTLFGDSPRALAATPDGHTVYAAVFLSGNRTATVAEEAVCDGGFGAPPCVVNVLGMPGGLPPPNANVDGVPGPETGLIVKYNVEESMWEDELGRNWNNAARFKLPDKDVFAIDAYADPPREVAAYTDVGTVLYNVAVNPVSGELYVSNTDARNEVRLEPQLRGHQHESRLTLIDAGSVRSRDLNKHLDCGPYRRRTMASCGDGGTLVDKKAASLALPNAIAVSADGSAVYVAGYGSGKIAVLSAAALRDDSFTPSAADQIAVGGGPSGLVLDESRNRLYVFTRFDNAVSSIDLASRTAIQRVSLFNPEPEAVRQGRRFLYDADYTSANGEASCASCHVFGDFDGLAWDLGTPDGGILTNTLPLLNAEDRTAEKDFHPLKGPMTTQTLQGMRGHGPMHWRGDRNGSLVGGDPMDERAAFRQFNAAFDTLLGRDRPLTDEEMERFTDFILAVQPPPNPYRPLDNALTSPQQAGRDAFFRNGCSECHQLDPANGRYGTSRASAVNSVAPQFMKVPQLRNLYRKIGRFFGILFQPLADTGQLGDQIRGFGFQHDGSAGRTNDPADAFLLAFDSNFAPAVGQQVTLTASAGADVVARLALLEQRADAGECDLVARGIGDGRERGWLRSPDGSYAADRSGAGAAQLADLRAQAADGLTVTCVPPGSGHRVALDRDRDGILDGDEILAGSDPADPRSVRPSATATPNPTETPWPTQTPALPEATATITATPAPTMRSTEGLTLDGDCDGDGEITPADLRQGIALLFGGDATCALERFDLQADGRVVAAELIAVLRERGAP